MILYFYYVNNFHVILMNRPNVPNYKNYSQPRYPKDTFCQPKKWKKKKKTNAPIAIYQIFRNVKNWHIFKIPLLQNYVPV